jgi:hypothetical protein
VTVTSRSKKTSSVIIADDFGLLICHLLVSPNDVAGSKTFHSNGLVELEKFTNELNGGGVRL